MTGRALHLLVALSLLLASGCATTRVVDTWRDPGFHGPPLRKVLVVGMSPDGLVRRSFEDRFVVSLRERGLDAIASYRELPDIDRPTDAQLREAIARTGVEGALITHLIGVAERTYYEPGYPYAGVGYGYGPLYPYYMGSFGYVYSPGYLRTDTIVRLQTRLFRADNGTELVWIGTSETFNPSSEVDLVREVIPRVVDSLAKAKLI